MAATRRAMLFGAAATALGACLKPVEAAPRFIDFGRGTPVTLHGTERVVSEPKLWGRVTVEGHQAHKRRTGKVLRVFVRGEDVTRRCVMANDRAGKAILFLHDENGRCYVGPRGGAARELYRGPVQIVECDA